MSEARSLVPVSLPDRAQGTLVHVQGVATVEERKVVMVEVAVRARRLVEEKRGDEAVAGVWCVLSADSEERLRRSLYPKQSWPPAEAQTNSLMPAVHWTQNLRKSAKHV